jgi:transcriptional regulator with XRE-family HTH domain
MVWEMQTEPDGERPEQTFAQRMRVLREELGVPQTHIAMVLKLTHGIKLDPSAITRIEKGSRALRLNEAVAIAKVLGQTVDEMLRPTLAPDEQLRLAADYVEPARWPNDDFSVFGFTWPMEPT